MEPGLKAYFERFQAVAKIEQQEQRSASLELRWQQLNAVAGLAIGLGIFKQDASEEEIYQRWAKLKNQHLNLTP